MALLFEWCRSRSWRTLSVPKTRRESAAKEAMEGRMASSLGGEKMLRKTTTTTGERKME